MNLRSRRSGSRWYQRPSSSPWGAAPRATTASIRRKLAGLSPAAGPNARSETLGRARRPGPRLGPLHSTPARIRSVLRNTSHRVPGETGTPANVPPIPYLQTPDRVWGAADGLAGHRILHRDFVTRRLSVARDDRLRTADLQPQPQRAADHPGVRLPVGSGHRPESPSGAESDHAVALGDQGRYDDAAGGFLAQPQRRRRQDQLL